MFKSFLGGIHPHDGKELAKDQPIEAMPVPQQLDGLRGGAARD